MKVLNQLVSAVDAVVATTSSEMTHHEIAETLRVVSCQMSRLQAVITERAVAMDRTSAHKTTGHRTPAEFLKRECHYSGAQARSVLRSGAVLAESLPRTADALKAGTITWPHATTLVRGVEALGADEVAAKEETWITNVAVQSSPERLQRVVRARVHEKVPKPRPADDQVSDQSTGILLRRLAKRGYEVTGFLSLADGAAIEQAVSKLRSLENAPEDTEPITTIASRWLQNAPAAQPRPHLNYRDESLVDLFSGSQAGLGQPTTFPTVKRYNDFDPVPVATPSPKPLTIAKLVDGLPETGGRADRCMQPGCSAVPHWCDYHGSMNRLGHKLLTAA
jgi:hypothetical protein